MATPAVWAEPPAPPLPGGMHDVSRIQQNLNSTLSATPQSCDGHSSASVPRGQTFVVTVGCKVACNGDPKKHRRAVSAEFKLSPSERKLVLGDGSIPYAALTGLLLQESRFTCLEAAAQTCKGIHLVKKSSLESMSSGSWKVPAFDACREKVASIASPYAEGFHLSGSSSLPVSPQAQAPFIERGTQIGGLIAPRPRSPKDYLKEAEGLLPEGANSPTLLAAREYAEGKIDFEACLQKGGDPYGSLLCPELQQILKLESQFQEPKTCKNTVSAESCYGDCMSNGAYRETLGSQTPNARTPIRICADPLIEGIRKAGYTKTSKAVLRNLCEDFVSRTLLNHPSAHPATEGRTCAAYRFSTDCKGWVTRNLKSLQ